MMLSELKWNYFTRSSEINRNLNGSNEIKRKTFICILQDVHFCSKNLSIYGVKVRSVLIFFLLLTQKRVQNIHRIPTSPSSLSSRKSNTSVSWALITFKFKTKCESYKLKNIEKLKDFPVLVLPLSSCHSEADALNIPRYIPAEVVVALYIWHWPREPWLHFFAMK